ncbi:MAG: glycosyltransferase family 4 protein, partial [Candidatus Dormibacteraeota bacterium]|nr:glycosyltransferase family 4 protein [Candidatus Dormibacteraeota bacterium]
FFAPSHVVPFLAPGPALTVVHDLAFERFPDAYRAPDRAYLRLTTAWAERRCARIITVSQSTAADLAALHGVDPARIDVVPLGGGERVPALRGAQARNRVRELGVDGPYVLHVGRVEARKNQITALAAVERLGSLQLVCAGPVADHRLGAQLAASERCLVLGPVSPAALDALYAGAEALAFPSLYEGFGLPVLEAMKRGLPVATSRVSSLPEVGGAAALYIDDPADGEALAGILERAMAERPERARLGRAQAARFTWQRTASGVAAVMRRLLGLP